MDEKIMEIIHRLIEWIYKHYGRLGCGVFTLMILAALTLIFILLNKLPEPREVIVWSKCSSCKYKRSHKEDFNTIILSCPAYEKPRWNQLKPPACPIKNLDRRKIIIRRSNPAAIDREDL